MTIEMSSRQADLPRPASAKLPWHVQTDVVSADQGGFGGVQRREIARETWLPSAWDTEGIVAKFITNTVVTRGKYSVEGTPELWDAIVEEQQEHADEFMRVQVPVRMVMEAKQPPQNWQRFLVLHRDWMANFVLCQNHCHDFYIAL